MAGSAGDAPKEEKRYSIGVIGKAAEVLSIFSHARPALSLKEVSTATGLPKTTAFRILSTLVEHDLCEFDPETGKYSLGFALLRLADVRRRQANVHMIAIPIMREIRNLVQETVVLSVRSGETRVHIDVVEGLHPMRRTADLGVSAPLYVGAASKVLLAGLQDAEIEDYLSRTPLTPFQETTITDKASLWAEINLIRERGFAESRGELIAGGGALAAPLKDFSGRTVGVIDILTPENRYTAEHRERAIQVLLDGARRASEKLGYRAAAEVRSPAGLAQS